MDIGESLSSSLEDLSDTGGTSSVGIIDSCNDGVSKSFLISLDEIIIIKWLNGIITKDVVVDIVGSVSITGLCRSVAITTIITVLMGQVVSVGVSVEIIVTNIVSVTVLSTNGGVWSSLVDTT